MFFNYKTCYEVALAILQPVFDLNSWCLKKWWIMITLICNFVFPLLEYLYVILSFTKIVVHLMIHVDTVFDTTTLFFKALVLAQNFMSTYNTYLCDK